MPSKSTSTPTKFQTEMQTAADALSSTSSALFASLFVLGSNVVRADVVAKLRSWIAIYAAVTQAKASYVAAVAARKAIEVTARLYLASVIAYIKQVVGPNNPALLATFGIAPAKARTVPSTKTKAVAQAKAEETRKARGTMSKAKRQAITAGPQAQVQVVGIPTASSTTAAPAVPAAVPSAAVPASTPAAPAASVPAAAPTPGSSNPS